MSKPYDERLEYPDPPPSRLPTIAWTLLLVLAVATVYVVSGLLARYLRYTLEWSLWASAWMALATAIIVGTPLLTAVAWAYTPRGGWPVEFRLPLIVRMFLRVLFYFGGVVAVAMAATALMEAGVPQTVAVIGAVVVLAPGVVVIAPKVKRWCGPVDGGQDMYDHLRPRGTLPSDPVTPEQIETVTGRRVAEVIRLDRYNPKVLGHTANYRIYHARFVIDETDYVEVKLLFRFGQASGVTRIERAKSLFSGVTPAARLEVLQKTHRLEPAPGVGEESYACVPLEGGDEWLWTRLTEHAVLETRTSSAFGRSTRARLAQSATA